MDLLFSFSAQCERRFYEDGLDEVGIFLCDIGLGRYIRLKCINILLHKTASGLLHEKIVEFLGLGKDTLHQPKAIFKFFAQIIDDGVSDILDLEASKLCNVLARINMGNDISQPDEVCQGEGELPGLVGEPIEYQIINTFRDHHLLLRCRLSFGYLQRGLMWVWLRSGRVLLLV